MVQIFWSCANDIFPFFLLLQWTDSKRELAMEALMAIDEACYNKLDLYFFLFEEQDVKLAFRTKELCTNHTLKCFCKLVLSLGMFTVNMLWNGSLPLFGIDDTHLLFLGVLYNLYLCLGALCYLFAHRHRCLVEWVKVVFKEVLWSF